LSSVFYFKFYIIFLGYLEFFLTDVSFHCADRGETRPEKIPALGSREDAQIAVDNEVAAGGLREVDRNLCGLTMGVPHLRR